jgi:type IV pilus assembly protein PilX
MNAVTLLRTPRTRSTQRGFSLITALLLMLSVLLLSLAVMSVNVSQERIIGNTRDRDIALQAAEVTLRDAERDIYSNITAASAFVSDCSGGLCVPPSQNATPNPKPIHEQTWFSWSDSTKVRTLGQYSGAPAIPNVSSAPVYVIERLGQLAVPLGSSVGMGTEAPNPGMAYRSTIRATGARPETQVILQSLYWKLN